MNDFHVKQIQKSEYITIDDNHNDPKRCMQRNNPMEDPDNIKFNQMKIGKTGYLNQPHQETGINVLYVHKRDIE